MTPQNASKLGRKLWRTKRAMFESRRKFGEEERQEFIKHEYEYNEYLIDARRTVKENNDIVYQQTRGTYGAYNKQEKLIKGATAIIDNAGLKPTEKKICYHVLTTRHCNIYTGLIRHKNGRSMNTSAIAELCGLNIQVARRALKGLSDKGIIQRRIKEWYYVGNPF